MKPRLLTPDERRVVRSALGRQIFAQERLLLRMEDKMPRVKERMIEDVRTAKQLLAILGRLEIKDD